MYWMKEKFLENITQNHVDSNAYILRMFTEHVFLVGVISGHCSGGSRVKWSENDLNTNKYNMFQAHFRQLLLRVSFRKFKFGQMG